MEAESCIARGARCNRTLTFILSLTGRGEEKPGSITHGLGGDFRSLAFRAAEQ